MIFFYEKQIYENFVFEFIVIFILKTEFIT